MGDTGLTGRKIIVDTYGGAAPHGGGAFSGKDPTKVDRSAAYAARYVAKNVVAAGLADRCQIQVAYAIGVAHPMSVLVETFGTRERPGRRRIEELVREHFDLRPAAILRDLDLRRPIYAEDGCVRPLRPRGRTTSRGSGPTAPTRCARPPASAPLRRSDEEAGGGLLRDRPLADLLDRDRELIRGRLGGAHEDARAGHEALVVEPVQEVAVVLGQADDRRPRPGRQRRERRELGVLRLLDRRVDGPAVRAALRDGRACRRSARSSRR